MTTINASQLPITNPMESLMRWDCDYLIAYNRRTCVLTVEDFEGFNEETGEEITTVITDPKRIESILAEHKPGWPSLDGFTLLADYYGDRWTIGTEPL